MYFPKIVWWWVKQSDQLDIKNSVFRNLMKSMIRNISQWNNTNYFCSCARFVSTHESVLNVHTETFMICTREVFRVSSRVITSHTHTQHTQHTPHTPQTPHSTHCAATPAPTPHITTQHSTPQHQNTHIPHTLSAHTLHSLSTQTRTTISTHTHNAQHTTRQHTTQTHSHTHNNNTYSTKYTYHNTPDTTTHNAHTHTPHCTHTPPPQHTHITHITPHTSHTHTPHTHACLDTCTTINRPWSCTRPKSGSSVITVISCGHYVFGINKFSKIYFCNLNYLQKMLWN